MLLCFEMLCGTTHICVQVNALLLLAGSCYWCVSTDDTVGWQWDRHGPFDVCVRALCVWNCVAAVLCLALLLGGLSSWQCRLECSATTFTRVVLFALVSTSSLIAHACV